MPSFCDKRPLAFIHPRLCLNILVVTVTPLILEHNKMKSQQQTTHHCGQAEPKIHITFISIKAVQGR
jgi:hypothetical protein